MRSWFIAITASLILMPVGTGYADEGKDTTLEIEYFYRKVYPTKPGHKAIAIGLYDSYGSGWGYGNAKEAATAALSYCRKGFAARKQQNETDSKCRVVVVGNRQPVDVQLTVPNWQVPATGEDKPLASGPKSVVPSNGARAILLAVHGCDGLGSADYNWAWGSYFNSLGLDYYAPDSFSDSRPHAVCGEHFKNGLHLVSEVYRLRIAQTHRTIANLRLANPGKPIYLWGHSEGSLIVQAIEAKVDGIIVSGDECGVLGMPVAAAPNIPFLYVLGADDKFVEGMKYPFSEKSLRICQQYMGKRKWKAAVVKDNGHLIWPWRKTAAEAIAKFVGGTWHEISPYKTSGRLMLTGGAKAAFETYGKKNGHRAFAANSNGDYAWAADWEYAEDAAQSALYICARYARANVFASHRHSCTLIDVDGKDQQK